MFSFIYSWWFPKCCACCYPCTRDRVVPVQVPKLSSLLTGAEAADVAVAAAVDAAALASQSTPAVRRFVSGKSDAISRRQAMVSTSKMAHSLLRCLSLPCRFVEINYYK